MLDFVFSSSFWLSIERCIIEFTKIELELQLQLQLLWFILHRCTRIIEMQQPTTINKNFQSPMAISATQRHHILNNISNFSHVYQHTKCDWLRTSALIWHTNCKCLCFCFAFIVCVCVWPVRWLFGYKQQKKKKKSDFWSYGNFVYFFARR